MGVTCEQPCVGWSSLPCNQKNGANTNNTAINTSIMIDYYGERSQSGQAQSHKSKHSKKQRNPLRKNIVQNVIKIQRAWRANVQKLRIKSLRKQHQRDLNTIFKGEFALTNDDQYEKYYDKAIHPGNSECEADLGSMDSDTDSQLVSLSEIKGIIEDYNESSTSLVNEFKIKAKKTSTPMQNMLFLPYQTGKSGVSIRTSRLGETSPKQQHPIANNFYESTEVQLAANVFLQRNEGNTIENNQRP